MMAKTLSSNTFTYVKKCKSVNIHFYISSRATLKETFTATYDCILPRTPKLRAKSKIYTPKRDDEHPSPFYVGSPHPGGGGGKRVMKVRINEEC